MKSDKEQLHRICCRTRRRIIEMARQAHGNGSHVGGSLSLVELLNVLYHSVMSYDTQNPSCEQRDRLILSKGHGAMGLYAVLEGLGLLTKQQTDAFEQNASGFFAHASRNLNHGIEFSGGSLSLGFSFGVGVALACKKAAVDNHIYVVLGDGECNEGMVWEAAMSAANFGLNNLTVVVDHNHLQSDGATHEVMDPISLFEKFSAFGFETQEVDGHNIDALLEVFSQRNPNKPNAIIAQTVKGKGVSFMEHNKTFHHAILSDQQYEQALQEIL